MRKLVLISILSLYTIFGFGQNDSIQKIEILLGTTPIHIVKHNDDSTNKIVFLNLHEDESTSIEAMKIFASSHPINYLYIQHDGNRRITFTMDEQSHNFDPNRIFTDSGLKATLEDGENYSNKAKSEVRSFGSKFLLNINAKALVVALHNNTNDNYSIKSYAKGGDESQNTKKIYINNEMDPDDFIYTTDKGIFRAMKKQQVNVILQHKRKYIDDGSLSVFCQRVYIRYVNIETEHGHLEKQLELMELIRSVE